MKTSQHGSMDFDFRRRCTQEMVTPDGLKYEIVFYGMSYSDMRKIFPGNWEPRELGGKRENYAALSQGGRLPRGYSYERERPKQFFTGKL